MKGGWRWLTLGLGVGHLARRLRWWPSRRDRRLQLPGLTAPVLVRLDPGGVPHIRGQSLEDVALAQGYLHARDRFFQMDCYRRAGGGRLAELLGRAALPADRFMRRIGLNRCAERDWAHALESERRLLLAYTWGVNGWLREAGQRQPLEYRLLGCRPALWKPQDSLVWARYMAFDLSANWECELLRWRLLERLGPERAAAFYHGYRPPEVTTLPGFLAGVVEELDSLYGEAARTVGMGRSGGSNAWAVSGERTRSGSPLLASDPHLVLRLPSTWHEVHLCCPELDVAGAGLPGLPGVFIGRNRHLAWGITNAFVDCQDLYLEEFSGGRYRRAESWVEPERVAEVIEVRGGQSVVEEVTITRHGPVVAGDTRDGTGLALQWTAWGPEHTLGRVLEINQARDARQLREVLRGWTSPCLNFVYADRAGNLGYSLAGRVPIRRRGIGLVPVPGADDEYAWIGEVPPEQLPSTLNPESGMVVSANQAMVASDYPYHLSLDFMNGYRAHRLEQLLAGSDLTADDFARFQMDTLCLSGLEFVGHCRDLGVASPEPLQARVLDCLWNWDGRAAADSAGAAIYEVMLLETVRLAFEPVLGQELLEAWMGRADSPLALVGPHNGRYVGALLGALAGRDGLVLGLEAGPADSAWRQILERALEAATRRLVDGLGRDPSTWRWGALHRLQLKHPLGTVPAVGRFLNGPAVECAGDTDTVLQTAVAPHRGLGVECWAPSWRQIVDLSEPEVALSVSSSGQSGHPGQPGYLDHFRRWIAGGNFRSSLDEGWISQSAQQTLRLEPGG